MFTTLLHHIRSVFPFGEGFPVTPPKTRLTLPPGESSALPWVAAPVEPLLPHRYSPSGVRPDNVGLGVTAIGFELVTLPFVFPSRSSGSPFSPCVAQSQMKSMRNMVSTSNGADP